MDRGKIKDDFQFALDRAFSKLCYANIQFLQLRSVDLPNLFEQSIQQSEVKKQDIQKAQAEQNKVRIEVDTRIKSAEYQKDVIINKAEGEAEAILKQNQANVESLKKIQYTQSLAYSQLKNTLRMTNEQLFDFIKSKLVKNYEGTDLAFSLHTPSKTNP